MAERLIDRALTEPIGAGGRFQRQPSRFRDWVSTDGSTPYAAEEYGHPAPALSINSHGFIADTSQAAADEAFPAFKTVMDKIGRERGWPPMTRAQFDASLDLHGSSFVGSPQQVIEKLLFQHEVFGHQRFLVQFSVGTLPHASIMRSIELFGTEVAPAVRREIERRTVASASAAA